MTIAALQQFHPAEPYHQNYLALHPSQPYIVINDQPVGGQPPGSITRYDVPTTTWCGEPVFVPDPEGGEGDGWLLTMVLDARIPASYLAVFDSRRVDEGPVAKLVFHETLPISFHGTFVPT